MKTGAFERTVVEERFAAPATARPPRYFAAWIFGAGSFVCLLGALTYGLLPLGLSAARQHGLVLSCVLASALIGACGWIAKRFKPRRIALLAGWIAIGLLCFIAIALDEGVHSLVLGYFGLVICAVSLSVDLRAGLSMAAACAVAVLSMAAAESGGGLHAAPATGEPLALAAITQLLMLGFSLAVSTLIARLTSRYLEIARQRERRLRSVLHMAAQWYWEMDAAFRFTHVTEDSLEGSGVAARTLVGSTPWEIEGFGLDPAAMDRHRADLEARRPFDGMLVRQHDARGRRLYARISGEPRFNDRGSFLGYTGIGRDATREVTAQRAVAASETRYRELFLRTPSPLVLDRWGRVIDANAAGLALFGCESVDDLIGTDIVRHYPDEAAVALARRRIHELEAASVGTSNDEIEVELRTQTGRLRRVRVSSVRVQAADGPATLSIFLDETERLIADAALRRSEALLSHVVETSPDLIMLSDVASGRLAMVNAAFTRLSGYSAEDAVGRTTDEIELWQRPADRARLVEASASLQRFEGWPATLLNKRGEPMQTLLSMARFQLDGSDYQVTTARDVTQAERLRHEYEAMLTYAAVGIAFTRDGRFVQTNLAWERMFRWPAGGLIGQRGTVVWPDRATYLEVARNSNALLLAGQPFEGERKMRRADGSTLLCHLRAQVIDPAEPSLSGVIWIVEDVTERRRVEQTLAAARDAAESANRAKSSFLANTSHEIRTPLNGLLGLTRLAMNASLDTAQRMQYLGQILDSANNLSHIISDILDLSKIEAGKLSVEYQPFDLRALLDPLQRAYGELARAHGLGFALHIDEAVPRTVFGDALRLRQILSNYINNALKFTERGEIRVDVRSAGDVRLRFTVADTGCGMDEATLARLFKPFTQADDSTTRRYGGTGLGLSICRQLAALMGGEVGADSEVGVGSRFWAELPLPAALQAEGGDVIAPDDVQLAGARVLMVEDNPVNMMIAVATLEQWGVQVEQAVNGRLAIDAVAQATASGTPFQAVLMDVQMPVMGGHEAARHIRRLHDARALPIIAITAAALISERDEAFAAGMNEFLTKPIDAEKLRLTLGRVLADAARPD